MSPQLNPFNPAEVDNPVSAATLAEDKPFDIGVMPRKTQTSGEVIVTGSGATGGSVEIHYLHVPGMPVNITSTAYVSDGAFEDTQHWPLSNGNQEDAFADVFIMARDPASGAVAIQSVKAEIWIT